jgi:hypothetical protein
MTLGGRDLAPDRETTNVGAILLTRKTNHKCLLRFVERCFPLLLKMNRDGYVHVVTNG